MRRVPTGRDRPGNARARLHVGGAAAGARHRRVRRGRRRAAAVHASRPGRTQAGRDVPRVPRPVVGSRGHAQGEPARRAGAARRCGGRVPPRCERRVGRQPAAHAGAPRPAGGYPVRGAPHPQADPPPDRGRSTRLRRRLLQRRGHGAPAGGRAAAAPRRRRRRRRTTAGRRAGARPRARLHRLRRPRPLRPPAGLPGPPQRDDGPTPTISTEAFARAFPNAFPRAREQPTDGTTVRRTSWTSAGKPVVGLWMVGEGGHTWPGGRPGARAGGRRADQPGDGRHG